MRGHVHLTCWNIYMPRRGRQQRFQPEATGLNKCSVLGAQWACWRRNAHLLEAPSALSASTASPTASSASRRCAIDIWEGYISDRYTIVSPAYSFHLKPCATAPSLMLKTTRLCAATMHAAQGRSCCAVWLSAQHRLSFQHSPLWLVRLVSCIRAT